MLVYILKSVVDLYDFFLSIVYIIFMRPYAEFLIIKIQISNFMNSIVQHIHACINT